MTAVAIQIESARLERYLREFGPALTRNLRTAVQRSIVEMARTARRNAPKAFSTLTQSISFFMSLDGLEGTARPAVNYGAAVERGTGRFGPSGRASGKFPPLQPLIDWIRVKRIQPDDPAMDQEDLAWLFARAIAMRGTPKQPYMVPAFDQHKAAAAARIDRAVAATIAGRTA
jgi:hypothetical protein